MRTYIYIMKRWLAAMLSGVVDQKRMTRHPGDEASGMRGARGKHPGDKASEMRGARGKHPD